MKTLPHQVSNVEKLTKALGIVVDRVERNLDVSDSALGPLFVRASIRGFRGDLDIEAGLAADAAKERSNRSVETTPRDLKAFFRRCGFIVKHADGSYGVTPRGSALVKAKSDVVRNAIWREGLLSLPSDDVEPVSHPYRTLLRLVHDFPGIETAKLMLAFEPNDDSEAEYERLRHLVPLSLDEIIEAVGTTKSNAANAIKILPSIAQQLGDIVRDRRTRTTRPLATFDIDEDGLSEVFEEAAQFDYGRSVSADAIAQTPRFSGKKPAPVDLSAAITLRNRRISEHQQTVRSLAKQYADAGYSLRENPYDCLAVKKDRSILNEVKTLDGSAADERRQIEKALSQLHGYRFYELRMTLGGIPLVAAFPRLPSSSALAFLRDNGLASAWLDNNQWRMLRPTGENGPFAPDSLV